MFPPLTEQKSFPRLDAAYQVNDLTLKQHHACFKSFIFVRSYPSIVIISRCVQNVLDLLYL